MVKDKSNISIFKVQLLEKLLNAQYTLEKRLAFNKWLTRMNELDFQKRTRVFFTELRRKYKCTEMLGPILYSSGIVSRSLSETLKNWSDFYAQLYQDVEPKGIYQTPDEDPVLDKNNTLMKIYDARISKSLVSYLEQKSILSHFQAAYCKHRSTADHILIMHEIFLEYRFNKIGPQGSRSKKRLPIPLFSGPEKSFRYSPSQTSVR